jgi:hypothetical protein
MDYAPMYLYFGGFLTLAAFAAPLVLVVRKSFP